MQVKQVDLGPSCLYMGQENLTRDQLSIMRVRLGGLYTGRVRSGQVRFCQPCSV